MYFTVIGEEFEVARVEGERQLDLVREFLEDHHLSMDEVVIEPMVVTDRMANPYESMQGGPRYRVRAGVSVRTSNVGAVKRAALDSNQLIRSGVLLEPNRPAYSFTSLNALKPEMLAEATAAARLAAEQFAKDSKSRVGSIRDANQGVFSIDDAYPGDPESGQGGTYATDKKVRVVSTISFYLE